MRKRSAALRLRFVSLLGCLGALGLWTTPASAMDAGAAADACSAKESGVPDAGDRRELISLLEKARLPSAVDSAYRIPRLLYQLGLVHSAQKGFAEILQHDPVVAFPLRMAAIRCLNVIHAKYLSLDYLAGESQAAVLLATVRLQPDDLEQVRQARLGEFFKQLSDHPGQDLLKSGPVLGMGPWAGAMKALSALNGGAYENARDELQKFLDSEHPHPGNWKTRDDFLRLQLARVYYGLGDTEKAGAQYAKIPEGSPYFATALAEGAWAKLANSDYGGTLGVLFSFRNSSLVRAFTPEVNMASAQALYELCNYPETIQALQQFQLDYQHEYDWLRNRSPSIGNPYQFAVTALAKGGKEVPPRIASEWLSSSIFTASQEEINLIFKERRILKTLPVSFPRLLGSAYATRSTASRTPATPWVEFSAREKALVDRIDRDMRASHMKMLSELDHAMESAKLLEAEALQGIGRVILRAQHDQASVDPRTLRVAKSAADNKALDWGRAPTSTRDGKAELWGDEIGALKADLTDRCTTSGL